ncbi:hypothetical protein [Glycomyces algeriensis]|uniref:Uncharacterized protein n=1 Tax=Glycomyces algeriensis TaxID=256037 RepID=A0A9W6GBI4_9ACTN|nr:hypothetical protein [Glycomyces algeriensis]MDA1366613.1 hypothetical protein [Glycomyces algeriensis]MDR7352270.1 hypothetical protein [Glycomyces algeriensis]GLI45005.1 hypothetical protein GALLR39Z86_48550 [Glycomyces algeriensis]
MRQLLSRYGPVLLWQFAWLALVSLPLATLIYWLASDGTFLMWAWAAGVLVLAAIAAFNLSEPFARLISWRHRFGRLAVDPDRRVVVLMHCWLSFPAILPGVNTASDWGFASGMRMFAVMWVVMFAGAWIWWALIGRGSAAAPLPPPTLPGSALVDARIVSNGGDEDPDTITVSVAAREPATNDKALYSVMLLQLMPSIKGGERRWNVRIDGESAATVTQTWEHPRWWPPIEWTGDASAMYAGKTISFTPTGKKEHDLGQALAQLRRLAEHGFAVLGGIGGNPFEYAHYPQVTARPAGGQPSSS